MVHHARQIPGSESVINIYHTDAARAGVQHRKERRDTSEGCPVSDTRRHRNHRAVRKTADHACECAFHPRDRDDHAGIHDRIHMGHQAVKSRNSHIIEALHPDFRVPSAVSAASSATGISLVPPVAHDDRADAVFFGKFPQIATFASLKYRYPLPFG